MEEFIVPLLVFGGAILTIISFFVILFGGAAFWLVPLGAGLLSVLFGVIAGSI